MHADNYNVSLFGHLVMSANAIETNSIPGQEDPLEKKMVTVSSSRIWEIPWTEESGRLLSIGLQKVRQDPVTKQQQKQQILN